MKLTAIILCIIQGLKSSFIHSTVPNSWIASQVCELHSLMCQLHSIILIFVWVQMIINLQLLDRIKDEWEIQGKITSKDVSAMQECLASMFKNYGTINLASAINVTDFIELDQTCKATVSYTLELF